MNRLAIGLALLGLPASSWADTRRFALVAGANDGGDGRVALRYAVSDAQAFSGVLEDLGGVPRSNQTLLIEPDRAVLAEAIAHLAQTVHLAEDRGLRTEVVVYYSGHSDEEGLLLGDTTYGYAELRADLEGIGADVQVVVLDSCASGALVMAKGGVKVAGFLEDQSNDVEGTAYLMSATADEAAQESDVVGGSFFTHYLVSGLRGGADHTQDGRVTLHEAYTFAKSETLRRTERTSIGPQHATHAYKLGGHGDFVFTDLSETSSSLVFDEGMVGRVFVREAGGQLVAELNKTSERAVELALRPGTYVVVLEEGAARQEAVFHIGEAEHVTVGDLEFTPFVQEQVAARGPGGTPSEPASVAPVAPPVPVADLQSAPPSGGRNAPEPSAEPISQVHPFIARSASAALQIGVIGAVTQVLDGVQFGGVFVSSAGGRGLQSSILSTHADDFSGAQMSFGVNAASGLSNGWQGAMFMNVASGTYTGAQTAAVNVGAEVRGAQIGLVNRASAAKGLQLGLVNSGGDGNGLQVGLVNVARDFDGASVALVSVHKRGYNHLFVNGGTLDPVTLGATWGSRYVYSGLQLGAWFDDRTSAVFAVGGHLPLGSQGPDPERPGERGFYLDLDLGVGYRFSAPEPVQRDVERGPLARLRVQPGFAVGRRLAFQTGVVVERALVVPELGADPADWLAVGWTFGVRL